MNKNTAELIQKLKAAQKELQTAGPIHRRDLTRHIWNLKREIQKAQIQAKKA